MQPTIKKVHSVDYTGHQQQQQQQQSDRSIRGSSNVVGRNAPLMHSVSIVVELANESYPNQLTTDTTDVSCSSSDSYDDQNRRTAAPLMGSKTSNSEANDGADEKTASRPTATETKSLSLSSSLCENEDQDGDEDLNEADEDDGDEDSNNPIGCKDEDNDEEEDDDEDEATEAASECLSSELARKVVIVDEADKILLWNRAHSAEPKFDLLQSANLKAAEVSPQRPSTSCGHQEVASADRLATLRSNTMNCDTRSAQDAQLWWHQQHHSTCSNLPQQQQQQHTHCARGSTGELAERGELSKLSMRRYTHHQVQYSSSSIGASNNCVLRNAINHPTQTATNTADNDTNTGEVYRSPGVSPLSSEANLDSSRISNSPFSTTRTLISPSSLVAQQQSSLIKPTTSSSSTLRSSAALASSQIGTAAANNTKNWSQHRRQSLQISLLSGGVCAANKSLTEEELRGEREFNEQVRIAKSPELFTTHHHHHQQQQQHRNSNQTGQQQSIAFNGSNQRCQSVSGAFVTKTSPTSTNKLDQQHQLNTSEFGSKVSQINNQIPKPSNQQSQQQINRQHHTPRRVSFSSIDPILVNAEPIRSRASVAYYPTTSNQHLLLLEQDRSTNATLEHHSPDEEGFDRATDTAIKSTSTNRPQVSCLKLSKFKRHSLAANHYPLNSSSEYLVSKQQCQQRNFAGSANNWTFDKQQQQQQREEIKEELSNTTRKYPSTQVRKLSIGSNTLDTSMTLTTTTTSANISTNSAEAKTTTNSSNTAKMNDNILSQREVSSKSLGAQARTFSATLDGRDMDAPQVTSSTSGPQTTSSSNVVADSGAKSQARDANKVQSIMANAKLRQEEFARLLEEHEQIINEIHRVETKISSSQTNLQQQQQQQQQQENK